MAVLQMQKIGICALKKDRQEILEKIQTLGTIELSDDKSLKELDGFVTTDTKEVSREFSKKLSLTEQALEVMDTFSPETKGMFSSLEGKPLIDKEKLTQEMQNAKTITELADQVISWSKEYSENKALVAKINEKIEGLKPWQELDIPFDLTETKKTKVLIGTMPPDMDEAKIHELVQKKCDEEVDIDLEVVCMDSDAAYIVVIAKKDVSGKVEDALRSGGFAKSSLGYDKTPREQIEKLEADIESINQTSEELEKKITEAAESRDKLREACDYFRMRLKNVEVTGELRQSERTFVMTGFIPKDKASRVKELLEGSFDCVIELADVTDEDEAPTVLKNNSFSSSAEGVLESYGLPKLRDIDPTKVMSYFYVFFFGMMLSDAAYGLLMSIGCFIVLKKFPKMEEGMKKMLKLFGFCGLSTLFWGVMFGGYFGDAPTVIAKTFFGKEFAIKPLWFAPLDNPMRLLIWCNSPLRRTSNQRLPGAQGWQGHRLYLRRSILVHVPNWTYPLATTNRYFRINLADDNQVPCISSDVIKGAHYRRNARNSIDVRKRTQECSSENCARCLRYLRSYRMAQRCAIVFKTSCVRTCNWCNRQRYQYDGKHGRRRSPWSNHLYNSVHIWTYNEYGNQCARSICSHEQTSVCRILRQVLRGRRKAI